VPLGLLAGYFAGPLDDLISRLVDMMMTLPGFLLALVLVTILGPGMFNVSLAVGAYMVPHFVRVTRGDTMAARQLDYITAARTVGAGDLRIILRHILPNVFASILVLATLRLATAVLIISGLSFLGLGARPPTPEWGAMIATARNFLLTSPHAILFPGIALVLAVYSLNTLGDSLRDALDPHLRGSV
jgi:peptide/nickel transport system permease protein